MRTKEFISKVEALGYRVDCSWGTIYIKERSRTVISLEYVEEWDIDTDYLGFDEMRWADKKSLMRIVLEFLLTDPADREEEKRYRLRLNAPIVENPLYLHYGGYSKNFSIACLGNGDTFKTIFTESEIAEMDITGFVKEVEG